VTTFSMATPAATVWVVGDKEPLECPDVIICMNKRTHLVPEEWRLSIGTLILDEAHLLCTRTNVEPLLLTVRPSRIVAISAILERDDGMHAMIQSMTGPHGVYCISRAPHVVYRLNTKMRPGGPGGPGGPRGGHSGVCTGLDELPERHEMIAELIAGNRRHKTLCLARVKSHIPNLSVAIERRGLRCASFYGNKKKYVDADVVIGTGSKMGTGFDEKNACSTFNGQPLNMLIVVHSVKKWQLYEQWRGRVMRSPNPIIVILVDDVDMSRRHFDMLRPWIEETGGHIRDIELTQRGRWRVIPALSSYSEWSP
jgi:hypothetical protein